MTVHSERLADGERVSKGRTGTPQPNTSANAIALTFWIVLWGLNGASTALPFFLLGRWLGNTGLWLGIGICVHIIVSLVENHLWRSLRRCSRGERLAIAVEIFVVGVFDVLTAAVAFLLFFSYLGLATPTLAWYAVSAILAETIAIGAELMIRLHWRLMRA